MKWKKKDMRLLYELDANYRIPYSLVGKRVRLSQQLITYKINSFLKKGVIQGYCPLIDYSRFGLLNFMVFFKVHYRNEQSFQKIIELLQEHENVIAVLECDGKYDLAVIFAAKNPSSFNKKLKALISENPELRDWMILTTVVGHHYLRDYFVGKESQTDIIIGGDRQEIPLDRVNKSILRALIEGKRKVTEIAAAVSATPKTVIARLKWLREKDILKGHRLLLNTKALDISMNTILIKYRHATSEKENELRHFCKCNLHLTEFSKTFGEWDAVLHVETKDLAEFRKLFLQLRERFDTIIEDIDSFRVFAVHKRQFLPREIFS